MAVIPLHTPVAGACSCGASHEGSEGSIGKHPRTKNGLKDASTDPVVIGGWWRTWPTANIGLVAGNASGFWALDIDTIKGGELTLNELEAANGRLPETVEARTGSGGRHLLFVHPGHPIPNSCRRLGAGLDVRGDGGYIVAAPSMNSRGAYQWAHEPGSVPMAEAPAWLLGLLKPPERQAAAPPVRPVVADLAARRYGEAALRRAGEAIEQAGEGTRNHTLNSQAFGIGQLVAGGVISRVAAEVSLAASADRAGLNTREIAATIRSGLDAGAREPRGLPQGGHSEANRVQGVPVPGPHAADGQLGSGRLPGAVGVGRGHQPADPPAGGVGYEDTGRGDPGLAAEGERPNLTGRVPGEDDGEEKQSRFNLRPIAELLAEQIPPIEWLIAPYIEAGTLAALVAPPNLGKTLLAFHFATQVASAGHPVAIVEEEGGRRGFQKRISRAVEACGGIEKCKSITYSFKSKFSLLSAGDVDSMCEEFKGVKLIIIDSLAVCSTGIDENTAQEMGQVVRSLSIIAQATGATILIIHHTGKTKWKPGADAPNIGDGRGSGALEAALDTVLALAPLADSEQLEGHVSFGLYCTKQRDEERAAPQVVRIDMRGQAAVVEMQEKDKTAVTFSDSMSLDILAVVRSGGEEGVSKKQIEESVKGTNERKRAVLSDLKARGEVEEIPHGKYSRWRASPTSPNLAAAGGAATSPTSPHPVGVASGELAGRSRQGKMAGWRGWVDPDREDP
jgi:hypothetical protein